MRRKIWRMSEGQFQTTVPRIFLEPEVINETIVEGDTFNGSFSVLCDEDAPTKGLIYCDHPYIFINTPAFNEENSTITYNISADYLKAGDFLDGNFLIYSDSCVKKLPFHIDVEKKYPMSSLGSIKNVDDFCELARRSWKEARSLFYSPEFKRLMYEEDKDIRLLYRGFEKGAKSDANIEEFLAASGRKERVFFDVDTSKREYSFVSGNLKENIDITRSSWGYIKIDIESDADFITVENNHITSDFFLGSKLSLNFYIHKEKLHAGKNLGKITLKGMGIFREIQIVASTGDLYEKKNTDYIQGKKILIELYKTYERFRIKEIDSKEWGENTVRLADSILETNVSDRNFYRLLKTHALIVLGQRKYALDLIKNLRVDIVDKRSANWAYLLYLGALLEPDEEYVNKLRREIESIQDIHSENILIFWLLLFLKKEYVRDGKQKLRAIRHWINEGYNSPILYAECYEIFLEDTYLLDSFSEFNIQILSWADKMHGLTPRVCERLFDLLLKENGFDKKIFRILLSAYEILPNELHLKQIISYMLKGNAKDEEFIPIYETGIKERIKLTGLFEAYLDSLPLNYINKLSDITLRYFSYNTNISAERKALVYANIIMYKDEEPSIYKTYLPIIRDFCIEQMKQKKIDDNLIICYQDMLSTEIIDSRMADYITNIIFDKKIICIEKNARKVIIVEDQLKDTTVSDIINGVAFVPAYSQDYRIFIEMADGSISCDEKIFYEEKTIRYKDMYEEVRAKSSKRDTFFLHDFSVMERSGDIDDIYEEEATLYLFNDKIDSFYLKNHFHIFMGFFKEHLREDIIMDALMHENRYRTFDNSILIYLINLLIIDGEDEKAIGLLREHLLMEADKRQLLNCLRRYVGDGLESKGEFVLELCIHLLRDGYHSEETVSYLVNHFIGTDSDMRLVFKYANTDSEGMGAFCERFIVQGLYSKTITAMDDNILVAYLDKSPSPMIVEAYISYFSHLYLTQDLFPPESVFAILFRQLKLTDSVNDSCRFAYCKYLCEKAEISRQESEILDLLISDQLSRNIYFPFYSKMDESFIIKYHLYDRMYVSVETEPHKDLAIAIQYGNERFEVDLIESYDGIYVKDLVIFFGDTIYYSIFDKNDRSQILLSGEYSYQDVLYLKESRFYSLNRMQENFFFKEYEKLESDIIDYNKKIVGVGELFNRL